MVNVAMLGASGRMGRTIVPLLHESSDLRLSGALAAADDGAVGHDAGVISGMAPVGVLNNVSPFSVFLSKATMANGKLHGASPISRQREMP